VPGAGQDALIARPAVLPEPDLQEQREALHAVNEAQVHSARLRRRVDEPDQAGRIDGVDADAVVVAGRHDEQQRQEEQKSYVSRVSHDSPPSRMID